MYNNIQQVSDSYLCSNCGACSAICPKDAIEFNWSRIGRLYSQVNDKCVECGLCQKVCPSLDSHSISKNYKDKYVGNILNVYVGKCKIEKYYKNAQSGGVATAILSYLFHSEKIEAAIVCRMEYGKTPRVIPVVIDKESDLYNTQKSCYTPVALLAILKSIRKYQSVAIVGLPCHLQGLEEIQRTTKKFSNIKYRIGLFCDRTECSGIQEVIKKYTGFEDFIIHWKNKYNSRNMSYDYKNAPIVAVSTDGREISLPRKYRIGLKEMFTPPRCRVCWDKLSVFADISLGDPWRLKNIDIEKGESLIISRTEIGNSLLQEMKSLSFIDLRKTDEGAPIRSQLIDERKKKVTRFSQSFYVLNPQVSSPLLSSHKQINSTEENILRDFVDTESLSLEEMLKKAEKNISSHEKRKKHKNLLIVRLLSKLSSFFKK